MPSRGSHSMRGCQQSLSSLMGVEQHTHKHSAKSGTAIIIGAHTGKLYVTCRC